MIRTLALTVSMVMIAASVTAVDAASKPPRDERCKEWVQRSGNLLDWLKGNRKTVWVCVSGDSKGSISSASSRRGSSGTASTTTTTTTTTMTGDGKGNNGIGTPNGSKTDGGDPPGGGNTGNDGQG